MKQIYYFWSLFIVCYGLFNSVAYCQAVTAGDCSQAVNICTNASFAVDPNGYGNVEEFFVGTTSNPSTNPASGNLGCLLAGELNSTWMIINVVTSGTLEFSFGADGGSYCYDWIMWQYNSNTCSAIQNDLLSPIRCNWNYPCESFTGIANTLPPGAEPGNFEPALNVTCGQQFIICFSNYSSAVTSVPLNFFGTAQVSCTTFTPITVNNATICPGGQATLTANGGTSYTWSTGQTTASINVSPTSTSTYTVTGTGSCGTGTATATVTVLPASDPTCGCTVTAGNYGPYCLGQTISLTASTVSGATSYTWTGPNGFNSSSQNPTITNAQTVNAGVYTVTVNAGSNTCTATTTVVVNPLPTPTINATTPICVGQSATLTANGGGTYLWNTGATTQNITVSPTSTTTYTVTVTSAAGCSATATTNVTVNPLPTLTAGNNGPICTGATLNLTSSGGTGYTWSGPNGFTNNTQNPSITNAPVAASGTYTVTVTTGDGCTASTSTIVTINPLPTAIANNDGPICEGNTLNITAGGGVSYTWTGPANYTSNQQNNLLSNVQPNQSGTYNVTVTDNNGCSSTASTTVIVNALPVATANAEGPACEGLTISLSANGGTTYQWTGPNAFSSTSQNPIITGATTSNNGTYTVTVTDANGCSSTASTTITVYATPIASFTATNLSGCTPVCTDFTDLSTVNGSSITSWSWSSNGTNFSNQQNPTQCFTNIGLYDISLTVTSAQGCSATIVFNDLIQVFPNPIADFFIINSDLIFPSSQVAQFISTSSGNITSWNWDFGDGNTSMIENPIHNYIDTGEFCVTLTVITNNGCQASTQNCLYIYPEYTIYIPNTFTPNDDKLNDYFAVKGKGIKSIEMYIFNRWGEAIYSSDNLQGWSGFIRNTSEIAKQDVYSYKIYVTDILDRKHEYYGHVNLLR